jgi:two-component system OmpR family sensor kinase
LPTSDVDDTLVWVLVMFCIVGVIALIAATTAGILVIRRQFRPLSEVSAAARQVADLELDRGEVRLPTPIVKVDPARCTHRNRPARLRAEPDARQDRGALSARHASEMRVRQFVADASHELRTPLAAIRGYTELAQRKQDALPEDVAHAMSRVQSETERMTHLVEDMLLLARLDTGRPLGREQVDLSRLTVDAGQRRPYRGAGPRVVAGSARGAGRPCGGGRGSPASGVLANLARQCGGHTPPPAHR